MFLHVLWSKVIEIQWNSKRKWVAGGGGGYHASLEDFVYAPPEFLQILWISSKVLRNHPISDAIGGICSEFRRDEFPLDFRYMFSNIQELCSFIDLLISSKISISEELGGISSNMFPNGSNLTKVMEESFSSGVLWNYLTFLQNDGILVGCPEGGELSSKTSMTFVFSSRILSFVLNLLQNAEEVLRFSRTSEESR